MAGHLDSFSSSYYQPESPKIRLPKPSGSGLTLVIPSLKNLKAQKSAKEVKPRAHTPVYQDVVQVPEKPKIQRPLKLKPLKEVLSKLIAQLKKKDDYAFFLHPVDVASVVGYADIIKRPMDLGTMGDKVARGRYRSLEEFADDFRLVTGNAKLFNPPGSIYHTEADKLEAWGLDHIAKAAPTVIQYETDWNIDVEKDDEAPVDVVDEEPDEERERERSVSVMSQPQQPGPSTTRRGPRGPYKKHGQNPPGMSETLEPDGGLPGSKDGLGAFPVGSDWAKTMLALKRKGKRYKTKKERLRFEKEGPPLAADGSLDYSEMEDPFTVLSYFVPDPPSRPHLAPLFPTSTATTLPPSHTLPPLPYLAHLLSSDPAPQPVIHANAHPPPPRRKHWVISRGGAPYRTKGKEREDDFSSAHYDGKAAQADIPEWQMPREMQGLDMGSFALLQGELAEEMRRRGIAPVPVPVPAASVAVPGAGYGTPTVAPQPVGQLQFQTEYAWMQPQTPVMVNTPGTMSVPLTSVPGTPVAGTPTPAFVNPAAAHTLSTGASASASGGGAPPGAIDPAVENAKALEIIKQRLDCEASEAAKKGQKPAQQNGTAGVSMGTGSASGNASEMLTEDYWTTQRAAEAEAYVRDVVYGGVEGYAYIRSLAEFVDGKTYHEGAKDPEYADDEPSPVKYPGLGLPLAQWVEQNIVDPLTEGRHCLLRRTAVELARQAEESGGPPRSSASAAASASASTSTPTPAPIVEDGTIETRVAAGLHVHPHATAALTALLHIQQHKIDMGALIKTPDELFLSEEAWVGKRIKEEKARQKQKEIQKQKLNKSSHSVAGEEGEEEDEDSDEDDDMDVDETETGQTWAGADSRSGAAAVYEQEGPEELSQVLAYVADKLVELDRRNRERNGLPVSGVKLEEGRESAPSLAASPAVAPSTSSSSASTSTSQEGDAEDPAMREVRLNLLALAKRAPLDTIARLPKDLVPEHIRNLVPTLGSS